MATTIPLTIGSDVISSSTTSLVEGQLSATRVYLRIPSGSPNLSAIVTGVSFADTKNGAPIFKAGSVGAVFNAATVNAPPIWIGWDGSTPKTVGINLSASGNACAVGLQTLSYTITLSSVGLSADGAGNVVRIDVSNTTDSSLVTTVSATNTPFGNKTCRAEFNRLRHLEII